MPFPSKRHELASRFNCEALPGRIADLPLNLKVTQPEVEE
jgi:hypothetical protein